MNKDVAMLERSKLETFLNDLLTPELFDDYAPNGLQVEGKKNILKIAGSVSATVDAINQARKWGADALIVHHGLFWRHQGAKPIVGPHGQRIKSLIQSDCNLFAYHLPLDSHPEIGNAKALADLLNLTHLKPFGPYKKQFLGIQGHFKNPLSALQLKNHLETLLNHSVTTASPNKDALIHSIGIITGGANNEWIHAKDENLDAYLTGEISEYNWHDAIEANIHFFAGGHHATERFGIQQLLLKLQGEFKIETRFFDSENLA
jgi:dinuclear metal center YbgI/SA1388 family protein